MADLSEDDLEFKYMQLKAFSPETTLDDVKDHLRVLRNTDVVTHFDEQLFRLHGENPKVALKHLSNREQYEDNVNSALFKSASPSIGTIIKTQFNSTATDIHESILERATDAFGSIGIRRLQIIYTINRPFDEVRPTVDTPHDVKGVRLANDGRTYVLEPDTDTTTRAKVVKTDKVGLLIGDSDVDLAELTKPDEPFLKTIN